jgi:uncharacterized protein DUF3467
MEDSVMTDEPKANLENLPENPVVQTVGLLGQSALRSSEFRSFYSNSSKLRITAWDLTMVFQKVVEQPPGGLMMEELTEITTTVSQAKAFALALTGAVNAYEKTFGEITLDPVMMPNLEMIQALVTGVKEKMEAQRALATQLAAQLSTASK